MKACLIANTNMYDVKRHFAEELVTSLTCLDVDCRILDIGEKGLLTSHIEEIRAFQPDFLLSYHSQQPFPDGKFFWDYLQIPFLALLVDPAVYSMPLFNSPNTLVAYIDADDQPLLKAAGVAHTLFWPHAAPSDRTALGGLERQKRDLDLVFFGSFYDHEGLKKEWPKLFSSQVINCLERAIFLFYQEPLSLLEALWQALIEEGIPLETVDFETLFFQVDSFIRGNDRLKLLSSIQGIPLHLFGETHEETSFGRGWQDVLGGQKNIHIHPPVSYAESLEILKRSKIALNHSPFFRGGAHERILSAMRAEAYVVSNESRWLKEHFEPEELLTYSLQDKSHLSAEIKALLADEEGRRQRASLAQQKVISQHTFDCRAQDLVTFIQNALHHLPQRGGSLAL